MSTAILSFPVKEGSQCFSVSGFQGTSFGGPCKQKMPGSQVDSVLMSLIELLSPSLHTASNTYTDQWTFSVLGIPFLKHHHALLLKLIQIKYSARDKSS